MIVLHPFRRVPAVLRYVAALGLLLAALAGHVSPASAQAAPVEVPGTEFSFGSHIGVVAPRVVTAPDGKSTLVWADSLGAPLPDQPNRRTWRVRMLRVDPSGIAGAQTTIASWSTSRPMDNLLARSLRIAVGTSGHVAVLYPAIVSESGASDFVASLRVSIVPPTGAGITQTEITQSGSYYPVPSHSGGLDAGGNQLAVSPAGAAYVLWYDDAAIAVRLSRLGGGSPRFDTLVASDASVSALALRRDGQITVAWTSSGGSSRDQPHMKVVSPDGVAGPDLISPDVAVSGVGDFDVVSRPGSTETFLFGIPALDEMGR